MTIRSLFVTLAVLLVSGSFSAAGADDEDHEGKRRWWHGEWREDYWNRPCEEKIESKPGEFKREVKCKDGIGARWHGEWKEEFWDGPCQVKLEATREVFKEEVKCEDG
jgi:hypothetical protein